LNARSGGGMVLPGWGKLPWGSAPLALRPRRWNVEKTKATKRAASDANARNPATLTGAAWAEKPSKADGMTNAEGFTNRTEK